jgi:hypothetical protein
MKKKFLIGGAALLFAAVTALNMNLLQSNKAGDMSLDAIAVMAQAQYAENPPSDKDKGYGALDIPCFDNKGNPTGKNRRSCFDGGVLPSCRSHDCQ